MIALLLFALLQEPAVTGAANPAPAPAAAALPPASDPAAVALLAQLAASQYPQGAGRALDGFDVQLNWRERGEQVQEFGLGLNYSRRGSEKVAIRIQDRSRGTEVRKGFDGARFWLEQGEEARIDLSGADFEQDRKEIDEAIEFSSDLLLVLDLHAFARQAVGLSLTLDPAQQRVLAGQLRRLDKMWEFSILLPAKDPAEGLQPLEIRLREPNADPLTQAEQAYLVDRRFKLDKFKRFHGRSVPQKIHEFAPDEEEAARILEVHDLHWEDQPLPPPPAPKKAQ
jgi:hypothetical protein